MKLFIKQAIFSWTDKFEVKNEDGKALYSVYGDFFSWARRLRVYDPVGNELALVRERVWHFKPHYSVMIGGHEVATVIQDLTLLKPKFRVEGRDWEISGDFWEHEYTVKNGERSVATVCKQWLSWGDCYELDVASTDDLLLALCVVLTIDGMMSLL